MGFELLDTNSPYSNDITDAPDKSSLDDRTGPISSPDTATSPEEDQPAVWTIVKAIIKEIAETIFLALILVFLIQLVIRNFRVDGQSMEPNLHHGQYLMVDKVSYRLPFNLRSPQYGDVIVFVPPSQPDKDFIKRIIGLPGDTVEMTKGAVFVNGQPLANAYQARLDMSSMPALIVPEDEVFVMGDNRPNSNDSRNWGTLKLEKIVGRAWISYWPPKTWGLIPNDAPTTSSTLATLFNQNEAGP